MLAMNSARLERRPNDRPRGLSPCRKVLQSLMDIQLPSKGVVAIVLSCVHYDNSTLLKIFLSPS